MKINIETNIETHFTRLVTKFGNGAKINCPKKYINKKVIIFILSKKLKITKLKDLNIKDIEGLYRKKVTKFGTGAKIDCSKEFIGKEALILIL